MRVDSIMFPKNRYDDVSEYQRWYQRHGSDKLTKVMPVKV
jgi:hypothetical protein